MLYTCFNFTLFEGVPVIRIFGLSFIFWCDLLASVDVLFNFSYVTLGVVAQGAAQVLMTHLGI